MSLDQAASNPLGGAQAAESQFQGLWDAGAFNPDGKPDPAQGQEAPSAEGQQAAQPQQQTQAQAQPAEEGPEYADLSDYLTKNKIESESFYKMPVTVTVDGQSKNVPLSDLLRNYQQEAHFTQKSQKLAESQRQWEAERQQQAQAYQAQLTQAQALGNLAHQQLLGEFQQIDWNKLRIEDPARWAVMNTEFNQRAQYIQNHLAQVSQAQQQQQSQQMQELQTKVLPAERERLLELRPEWRDEKQFDAARAQMREGAKKLGFSDAEISQVYDHRYMIALDLASRYLQLQAQAPQAVKRVRTAPQVAQPGTRQTRDPNQVVRQQAKERFDKNRRDPDAQAAYFGTLA